MRGSTPAERRNLQLCIRNCVPPTSLIGNVKKGSIRPFSSPGHKRACGVFGGVFGVTRPLEVGVAVRDLSESVSTLLAKQLLELLDAAWASSPCFFPFRLAFERIRSRKLPCGLETPVSATN
jgi:hypothetical protein